MYEQFFQLERRPFAATPDPACFFHCESIAHVLDQLTVCIEHGQGIGILTSPAGMGKTLISQRMVKDLGERFRMIFLGNSNFPTRRSLLQAILFETGVGFSRKDEQELRHELRNVLRELRNDYESVVLIVDEAHSFEAELLEEIRTLVDLGDEGHSLVRVILSGQLELEERMTDRRFDAINQRISTHVYLEPLSIAESIGYLRHRVEWAGADPDRVFAGDAETIIARASCGVPRCLNQLADHSLLLGFAADELPVQEATVREALEDLKQLPLHWNDVNDADRMIASQMESDEAEADELISEIEAAWEAESSFTEESAEVAHDASGHEHEGEHPESKSHEAVSEDEAEEAAPLAVFEFGADDIEDSTLDDHDEGDTLDEVAATIDVAEVATGEEADEAPQKAAVQTGQPAPPVSEISGVVLDLSSQVCGVSECVDGVAEFGGSSQNDSMQTKTGDAAASHPESDAEFGAGLGLTEQPESHAQGEEPAAHGESAVFEFGAEDEADHAQNEQSESAEQPSMEDELEEQDAPEDVPGEEEVLAAISSVENEIVDFEAELHEESHEEEHHESAADHNTVADAHVEDVPTEEEVLAEIAEVEAEIAQVVWDEEVASEETGDAEYAKLGSEAGEESTAPAVTAHEEPSQEAYRENAHHEDAASAVSDAARSRFETEVVADPYAAIEEPLSAGIVWDVPSEPERDIASSQEVLDEEHAEAERAEESCEVRHDLRLGVEEVNEKIAEHSHAEEHCESREAAHEEGAELDKEVGDDSHIASQIELEEAIFAPLTDPVSDKLSEAIMQDWGEEESDEAAELDVVEEPTAELSLFAEEHREEEAAEADLDPTREIHPDRYLEAIVPMLGEIDQLCVKEFKADSPERDAVDIEAELVDAISGDNPDVEDEIGATVLDICLDAQWAIQQDGERTDESRESAMPFAEAEVESETEGYEIVEPEFPPETDFTSQVSELGKPDVSAPTGDRSSDRRPFGRLFSDLRRRDS